MPRKCAFITQKAYYSSRQTNAYMRIMSFCFRIRPSSTSFPEHVILEITVAAYLLWGPAAQKVHSLVLHERTNPHVRIGTQERSGRYSIASTRRVCDELNSDGYAMQLQQ